MPSGSGTHLLIPEFRRQRQVNLCELEASLVYRASSRTARATQRNLVLQSNKQTKGKKTIVLMREAKGGSRGVGWKKA